MATSLPLLPLPRVVLPGSELVIHANRPAAMAIAASGADRIGVALALAEDATAPVGTVVEIVERRTGADGRSKLAGLGRERFRVDTVCRRDPHLVVAVEPLGEHIPNPTEAAGLRDEVVGLARRFLAVSAEAGVEADIHMPFPADPAAASYQAAAVMDLSPPELQDLLELDPLPRLRRERATLVREIGLLARMMGTEGP